MTKLYDPDRMIYISGKISGLSRPEYMEHFSKAENELKMQGMIPLNPARVCDSMPSGLPWELYMNISIELLCMANKIFILDGWETSQGATIERAYAMASNYEIFYESGGIK